VTTQQSPPDRPIAGLSELAELFRTSGKPRAQWRVGTENEMIGVHRSGPRAGAAPPYEGPDGIAALLERIARHSWTPLREKQRVIGLTAADASISLEPGGQLELAARPVQHAADYEADVAEYHSIVGAASHELGLAWLGIGFRPFGRLDDVPWMPKGRYAVMRDYLPTRGRLAHEMMKRTATVQVNVDYADERDAAAKLRCIYSVTPLLTAIYANSPIVDQAISDYQSYRAHVWLHTDPDRCGLLPFAFADGDIFEAYTAWAVDVPMFFVYRHGDYWPAGGMTFRQFLRDGFRGERATIADWELHLSTVFPEGRLKRFIEVRGCDAGSLPMVMALGPLCRGVLYDDQAMADATRLTASLGFAQRVALLEEVARDGLRAKIDGMGSADVGALAADLVAIARDGLRRCAPEEERFLQPVAEIVETGRTQADAAVDAWRQHGGDPAALIPTFQRFA
jgi:glutamate--cysteine ligase